MGSRKPNDPPVKDPNPFRPAPGSTGHLTPAERKRQRKARDVRRKTPPPD